MFSRIGMHHVASSWLLLRRQMNKKKQPSLFDNQVNKNLNIANRNLKKHNINLAKENKILKEQLLKIEEKIKLSLKEK